MPLAMTALRAWEGAPWEGLLVLVTLRGSCVNWSWCRGVVLALVLSCLIHVSIPCLDRRTCNGCYVTPLNDLFYLFVQFLFQLDAVATLCYTYL